MCFLCIIALFHSIAALTKAGSDRNDTEPIASRWSTIQKHTELQVDT